jgi:putative SOS response-associated peptidase YedK
MCGRFTLTEDPAAFTEDLQDVTFPTQFAPRYNIAPTQPVLVIPNDRSHVAEFMLWGLIPSWAKDASISSRLINARGESLAEKSSFRGPYKYKRCLILADGFYEWKATSNNKTKVPHYVHLSSKKVFSFAGLWDEWKTSDGSSIRSCTIITTTANELMAPIHQRMPLILHPKDLSTWLDAAPRLPATLEYLIKPFPAELMNAYPVSALVSNPENDRPECIHPA